MCLFCGEISVAASLEKFCCTRVKIERLLNLKYYYSVVGNQSWSWLAQVEVTIGMRPRWHSTGVEVLSLKKSIGLLADQWWCHWLRGQPRMDEAIMKILIMRTCRWYVTHPTMTMYCKCGTIVKSWTKDRSTKYGVIFFDKMSFDYSSKHIESPIELRWMCSPMFHKTFLILEGLT